jgi:hypothetical protein
MLGRSSCFCDLPRRGDCPPDLLVVVLRRTTARKASTLPRSRPFDAIVPAADEPGMFLYTSGLDGHTEGRRALAPEPHLGGGDAAAPGSTPSLSDRGAALSHERAGAEPLACAAHATNVLLPQFTARGYIEAIERYRTTWLTAVPPMIAMMLREKDCSRAPTSQRRVHPHGLGAGEREPDGVDSPRAADRRGDKCLWHHRGRPVVFGPHPKGCRSRNVGRLSAPAGAAAARRRRTTGTPSEACWR